MLRTRRSSPGSRTPRRERRAHLEGGSLANPVTTFPPVGTWAWDGSAWTQPADVGPPQRVFAALAYDASRERVVHFGGRNRDGTYERDTWEWDGTVWEQVADMGPRARSSHVMTGTAGATLLVGGVVPGEPPYELLRDTWTWDGNAGVSGRTLGRVREYTPH